VYVTDDAQAVAGQARTGELVFPTGFVWGAATAAFQIEGATDADGRLESIWDTFCRTPGKVANGDTGDVAVDHYRRMPQDVALMADLGLSAYRFSLAWPRIVTRTGEPNHAGLDFYQELVDTLLEHGIQPWATLYHWDLPQHLEDAGGWTNRDTAYRFAEYAELTHAALGDRVAGWATLNEPWCAAFLGYGSGIHAPGRTDSRAAVAATHHLLLGHGLATRAIKAQNPDAKVGIVLNLFPVDAVDPADPVDQDAARRIDGLQNRIFLDPVLRGEYPADVLADLTPFGLPELVQDGDLAAISTPIDLLGVNYYWGHYVTGHADADSAPGAGHGAAEESATAWPGAEHVRFPARDLPVTAMGWEVQPDGLTKVLLRLRDEYPEVPLYVTENGAAYEDEVDGAGQITDTERRDYLDAHLRAAHQALEQGVPLAGYFCWSLLDNFEWAHGYGKRFGIVRVDYDTQIRTPKLSAWWYAQVARGNTLPELRSR
jgi:beta-glucosidase